MEKPVISQLSQLSTLPATVEECHVVIRELLTVISELCQRVETLERENAALKERLNINSSNSSLPPSKDFKNAKKKARSASARPSGGQVGHPGYYRKMLDVSEVDKVVFCALPGCCSCCGGALVEEGYERHQVYELPATPLEVTEYQRAKGRCTCCYGRELAALPEGVTKGITGSRLTALISHLVAKYHLSRRAVQGFLKEHYGFALSLGTVFNKHRLMNAVLEGPMDELRIGMEKSPWLNVDETGHRRDGKAQWLWGAMSAELAVFSVEPSRGKMVLRRFLGCFQQIIISDRYAAYNIVDSSRRQLCWAHLKRDFTRLAEKKEAISARLGKGLLKEEAKLFMLWNAFKQGDIHRDQLIESAKPIRRQVERYLEQGSYTDPQLKVQRFCKNLLDNFEALWTFLSVEGIEPTNNHAERCLRPAVLWRKSYFGTRSDYGSDFVARTASLLMTCQLQSKNAFDYLCQATQDYFAKTTAPPLLE